MEKLRQEVQRMLLDIRNLDYTLETESFDTAYRACTNEDRADIERLIKGCMIDDARMRCSAYIALRGLIRKYNVRGIHELRDIASLLGIKGWSRLTKEELLTAIERARNAQTDSESSGRDSVTTDGTRNQAHSYSDNCGENRAG